ncbi:MAG: hypothetical protein KDI02_16270 [Anaerolineae bacterium]|nr:hypothetical protein [Anaerolineae bacterium]
MPPLTSITPATYRITICGRLNRSWTESFGSMAINYALGADGSLLSVLTGGLVDQAALFGVLNGLYGLGLPLISVECLEINKGE